MLYHSGIFDLCYLFCIFIIIAICVDSIDLFSKHDDYSNGSYSNGNIIHSYPIAPIILQLHQDALVGIDRVQSRRLKSMGNVSISSIRPLYDKLLSDQMSPVFEGLGKYHKNLLLWTIVTCL